MSDMPAIAFDGIKPIQLMSTARLKKPKRCHDCIYHGVKVLWCIGCLMCSEKPDVAISIKRWISE